MKRLLKLLIIFMLIPTFVFAKEYTTDEFNYLKNDWSYSIFRGVTETLDGGYVAVGGEDGNYYLVKYDKNDNIIWEKIFDGYRNITDTDIDSKGNIYIIGYYYENVPNYRRRIWGFIAKYDKDGNLVTEKRINRDSSEEVYPNDIEINDDKIVLVGSIDAYLDLENRIVVSDLEGRDAAYSVVLDLDMEIISDHIIDYNMDDVFLGTTLTSDGGYVAVGYTYSELMPGANLYGYKHIPVIVKFDKNNKMEWLKVYPIDSRLNNYNSCTNDDLPDKGFYDVIEDRDGNYVVVGAVSTLSAKDDSLNASGERLGETYSDLDADYDDPNIMYYESAAAIIAKYDKNGNLISEKLDDYEGDDVYTDIYELKDGSFLVSANMGAISYGPMSLRNRENLGWNNTMCISVNHFIKVAILDDKFEEKWSKEYDLDYEDNVYNVTSISNGDFVIVGDIRSDKVGNAEKVQGTYSNALVVRVKVSYGINKKETENGTFTAQNQDGKADVVYDGDKGIIIPTPNEGYKVNGVSVVDSKGREVPVTKTAEGTYEYEIYDDTWVTVNFAKKELIEIPKTGIDDLLMFGFISLLIGGSVYFLVGKNQIFKKM